jgi:hypothetical protein
LKNKQFLNWIANKFDPKNLKKSNFGQLAHLTATAVSLWQFFQKNDPCFNWILKSNDKFFQKLSILGGWQTPIFQKWPSLFGICLSRRLFLSKK